MCADVFLCVDACFDSEKVEVVDGVCGYTQVSYVAGCVFVPCAVGCGDCALILGLFYAFFCTVDDNICPAREPVYMMLSLCRYELVSFLLAATTYVLLVLCLQCIANFW